MTTESQREAAPPRWLRRGRAKIVIATLIGAVLFAAVVLVDRTSEKLSPMYQGKPVRQWVRDWIERPEQMMPEAAPEIQTLRVIGADVVPYLVDATTPHPVREQLWWHAQRALPARITRRLFHDKSPPNARMRLLDPPVPWACSHERTARLDEAILRRPEPG